MSVIKDLIQEEEEKEERILDLAVTNGWAFECDECLAFSQQVDPSDDLDELIAVIWNDGELQDDFDSLEQAQKELTRVIRALSKQCECPQNEAEKLYLEGDDKINNPGTTFE